MKKIKKIKTGKLVHRTAYKYGQIVSQGYYILVGSSWWDQKALSKFMDVADSRFANTVSLYDSPSSCHFISKGGALAKWQLYCETVSKHEHESVEMVLIEELTNTL